MFAQELNIIDIKQGSPEWHEYRKKGIGASDAPSIMGVGFQTPLQKWKEKMGITRIEVNDRMQRGTDLEPIAREEFIRTTGIFVAPCVVESKNNPWQFASLDGLSYDGTTAVEIKCPGEKDHVLALQGIIPTKYFPQLQHQMLVLNLKSMHYFSFDGKNGVDVVVYADSQYQSILSKEEYAFYKKLITFEEPELTSRDYVQKTDPDFIYHGNEYRKLLNQEKEIESQLNAIQKLKEDHRNALIRLADKQNVEGGGVRVQQTTRKGFVDYQAIPELIGVDLEKYRKPSISGVRITEVA